MNDKIVTACVYTVKFVRFLALWIALYVTEKVYQDLYVSVVLIQRKTPPDLRPFMLYAMLADFVFFVFIILVVQLLRAQNPGKNYGIDHNLVSLLIVDYVASSLALGIVGVGVASVVQDKTILRYNDDGLRSIRALGTLLLYSALVVVALPYYVLLA